MISGKSRTGGWGACLLFSALISANSQNAAPLYREAFTYEERLNAEFPDEQHRAEVWTKAIFERDFDDDARRFLEVIDSHLDRAVEASALAECRWEREFYDDYDMVLARGQSLARMLGARMELRVEDGATDAALDDFIAIIRMSKNFEGEYRSVLGFLVKNGIQSGAINKLAAVLPRDNETAMKRVAEFWSEHRSAMRWELGDRIRSDARLSFDQIRRQLEAGKTVAELKELMFERSGINSRAPFFDAVTDKTGMVAALKALEEYDERGAAVCDHESFEDFNAAQTRFAEEYGGRPIERAWWYTSGESKVHGLEAPYLRAKRHQIVTAMFDLAIRRAIDGDRALNEVTDPATGRPFVVRDAGQGYVIESEFEGFEKPVRLTVGTEPSAAP